MEASFHDELAARYQGARSRLMGEARQPRASLRERLGYVMPDEPIIAAQIVVHTQDEPVAEEPTQPEEPSVWRPAWKVIAEQMCRKHGVTVAEILSPRREQRLSVIRQEIWYRLARETTMSLPQIGKRFNRDHTSILHGIRVHARRLMDRNSQVSPTSHSSPPAHLVDIRESS